jgi:hypothetical protein
VFKYNQGFDAAGKSKKRKQQSRLHFFRGTGSEVETGVDLIADS